MRHFKFDPVLKNDESFYWEAESMCVYAIHNNLSNINSLDELDIHAFYLFMFICVFFFFKTGSIESENNSIFHTYDHIKVLRIPL